MTLPAGEREAALAAPIVFFDGACLLCNRTVAFLARRDREGRLRFAHLQGGTAAHQLAPEVRDFGRDGSVVLLEPGGRVSLRSAAVLRSLAHASPRLRWLAALARSDVAVRVLDRAYGFVVRHRDAWFGRAPRCVLPDPAWRTRFVDDVPADATRGSDRSAEPRPGHPTATS